MLAQKIDRESVLSRHNPKVTSADPLSSLSVGNGHFVTTVDVTGLQSYPLDYKDGVPLCAMSEWGWHSFPNVDSLKVEESQKTMDLGHGHKEIYAVEYKTEGRNKKATEYYRANPHRLNLGNVALVIKENGKQIPLSRITDINQELDLYNGVITSSYKALGEKVKVTTACDFDYKDQLISRIESKLLSQGKASVCITFPYPTGKHSDSATDFGNEDKHLSEIVEGGEGWATIMHKIDNCVYFVAVTWEGKAELRQEGAHSFWLIPKGDTLSFGVEYFGDDVHVDVVKFDAYLKDIKASWNKWWDEGAFVDFGDCTDPRAKELERRTVLSQYLTYINCANSIPPQETGLTYNSWFGRPHLEMTWWHTVDFSLWNRPEILEEMLDGWYGYQAYPKAKEIAERQGFKGVRWMKMTDHKAGEAPSNVGSFLTWQQPHYIYMAEELYRRASDEEKKQTVLTSYGKYVEETAEFIADFAKSCQKDGKIRFFGQTAMQESMSKDFSYGHPFEQAYFVYGLTTAQKWRERQGGARNGEWDEIIGKMAPLPERDGIYTAGIPTENNKLSAEEFSLKCRSDHPAVLGACGLLPDYGLYDREKMQRTLSWVMDNWNWPTTWGWDYGMIAMCAARLGDGETAIRVLLLDEEKNRYLISGHNYQEPKRLRIYLPGNGALLDAIAMMCAGWDGCKNIKNPGFPQNGKWNVRWEGLNKMQ